MNQIELLLRLSENAQDAGDELATKQQQERTAHIKQLSDLWRMIEMARGNIEGEMKRFGMMGPPRVERPETERLPPAPGFLQKSGNAQDKAAPPKETGR